MNTLAIDVGGTKFTVALFEDERMTKRESRATDREGGPEAMLSSIAEIFTSWSVPVERVGLGFGGPVDFAAQKVVLSTHVSGWRDFPLVERVAALANAPVVMDNDANVGAEHSRCST
jgi:glucokinase